MYTQQIVEKRMISTKTLPASDSACGRSLVGVRIKLGLLTPLLLVLSACEAQRVAAPSQFCAYRRVDLAYDLYDKARVDLAVHFKTRNDNALGASYQSSQDSSFMARATRSCLDFDEVVRRQAIDLIRANILLQKLLVSNMRDQDPGVVVDLYGEQYREIFKTDIQ